MKKSMLLFSLLTFGIGVIAAQESQEVSILDIVTGEKTTAADYETAFEQCPKPTVNITQDAAGITLNFKIPAMILNHTSNPASWVIPDPSFNLGELTARRPEMPYYWLEHTIPTQYKFATLELLECDYKDFHAQLPPAFPVMPEPPVQDYYTIKPYHEFFPESPWNGPEVNQDTHVLQVPISMLQYNFEDTIVRAYSHLKIKVNFTEEIPNLTDILNIETGQTTKGIYAVGAASCLSSSAHFCEETAGAYEAIIHSVGDNGTVSFVIPNTIPSKEPGKPSLPIYQDFRFSDNFAPTKIEIVKTEYNDFSYKLGTFDGEKYSNDITPYQGFYPQTLAEYFTPQQAKATDDPWPHINIFLAQYDYEHEIVRVFTTIIVKLYDDAGASITAVIKPTTPAATFDLQGRRIANPSRPGIYIINGTKTHIR